MSETLNVSNDERIERRDVMIHIVFNLTIFSHIIYLRLVINVLHEMLFY